jgi:hypothetical protein
MQPIFMARSLLPDPAFVEHLLGQRTTLQGTTRPSKILPEFLRQQCAPSHRIQLGFYDPKKAIHHENPCGVRPHNHAGNPMPEATKATPVKQNVDSVRSFQQFSAALRSSPIAVVPSP